MAVQGANGRKVPQATKMIKSYAAGVVSIPKNRSKAMKREPLNLKKLRTVAMGTRVNRVQVYAGP